MYWFFYFQCGQVGYGYQCESGGYCVGQVFVIDVDQYVIQCWVGDYVGLEYYCVQVGVMGKLVMGQYVGE